VICNIGDLSLDDGQDILIGELVRETDSLRLMSDGLAVDNSDLELFNDSLVDSVTLGRRLA
jgi:hypothetical protein